MFPLHETCQQIFSRVLSIEDSILDKKALYEAMCLLSTMFRANLTIDYGSINGNLSDWQHLAGEEVSSLILYFKCLQFAEIFSTPSWRLKLHQKQGKQLEPK